MPERKELTASVLIFMIISWWFLPWIQYGPILQDAEYDQALLRAQANNHPYRENIRSYPFGGVQRDEGAVWFARYAQMQQLPHLVEQCGFTDIQHLPEAIQTAIIQGCHYGYFRGFQGGFVPQDPLSKAAAIVVITRILLPMDTFPDVEEFWLPYMEKAVQMNILHQPDHPYLMYPISRYELLLMIYRAAIYTQTQTSLM